MCNWHKITQSIKIFCRIKLQDLLGVNILTNNKISCSLVELVRFEVELARFEVELARFEVELARFEVNQLNYQSAKKLIDCSYQTVVLF